MSGWLAAGGWIDLVLALIVVEAAALMFARARAVVGPPASGLLANLAAGGCLLLAARLANGGAPAASVGTVLAAAFVAHLYDLALRWRRSE